MDSTKEALIKLQENGHFVALATGRAKFRAQQFQNEIGIKNMVCEGGNCIIIDHQEISYESLNQNLAKSIYYEAIEKGLGLLFQQVMIGYAIHQILTFLSKLGIFNRLWKS